MDNMFEKALRMNLRFETTRGFITTEDVFQLPLTSRDGFNLDDLAKGLNNNVKATAEESFVESPTKVNEELQLGFEIVKYIITVKKAEREEAKHAAEKRAQRQKLLALLTKKKDEALDNLTVEQIESQLAELAGV